MAYRITILSKLQESQDFSKKFSEVRLGTPEVIPPENPFSLGNLDKNPSRFHGEIPGGDLGGITIF